MTAPLSPLRATREQLAKALETVMYPKPTPGGAGPGPMTFTQMAERVLRELPATDEEDAVIAAAEAVWQRHCDNGHAEPCEICAAVDALRAAREARG